MLIYDLLSNQPIPPVSIDLLRVWERSENKIEGWTNADAATALRRYERFLQLIAAHPGMPQAPTRDIDEMWHLHMLSPKAYHEDCMRLFGEILDHDGGFGKGEGEPEKLQSTFEQTARMWLGMYGEPYLVVSAHQAINCWHDCVGRCWHACKSSSKPELQPRC
jgi:hypothetical protein